MYVLYEYDKERDSPGNQVKAVPIYSHAFPINRDVLDLVTKRTIIYKVDIYHIYAFQIKVLNAKDMYMIYSHVYFKMIIMTKL